MFFFWKFQAICEVLCLLNLDWKFKERVVDLQKGLKPGGCIVLKDNVTNKSGRLFDDDDHSWTRTDVSVSLGKERPNLCSPDRARRSFRQRSTRRCLENDSNWIPERAVSSEDLRSETKKKPRIIVITPTSPNVPHTVNAVDSSVYWTSEKCEIVLKTLMIKSCTGPQNV